MPLWATCFLGLAPCCGAAPPTPPPPTPASPSWPLLWPQSLASCPLALLPSKPLLRSAPPSSPIATPWNQPPNHPGPALTRTFLCHPLGSHDIPLRASMLCHRPPTRTLPHPQRITPDCFSGGCLLRESRAAGWTPGRGLGLSLGIWGQVVLCHGAGPVPGRMSGSIPGPHPGCQEHPLPRLCQQKCL